MSFFIHYLQFFLKGAPCHTSAAAQEWLEENMEDYWTPDMWPPGSPDLAPLDYAVWGYLLWKMGPSPFPSVPVMKQAVDNAWEELTSDYVTKVCGAFRKKLVKVVAAQGGIIEK